MKPEPSPTPGEHDQSRETSPGQVSDGAPRSAVAPPREPETHIVAQREIGGRKGADPTRYGDWEKDGRCIDF